MPYPHLLPPQVHPPPPEGGGGVGTIYQPQGGTPPHTPKKIPGRTRSPTGSSAGKWEGGATKVPLGGGMVVRVGWWGVGDPRLQKDLNAPHPCPEKVGGGGALPGFAGSPGCVSDVKPVPENGGRGATKGTPGGVWLIDRWRRAGGEGGFQGSGKTEGGVPPRYPWVGGGGHLIRRMREWEGGLAGGTGDPEWEKGSTLVFKIHSTERSTSYNSPGFSAHTKIFRSG